MNVRTEEGFKGIIEVVVIESLRQGYLTIGAIVWTTFLSKEDTQKCLDELIMKGVVIKSYKRQGFNQMIPIYDLEPEMGKKIGVKKRTLLGLKTKTKITTPVKNLKEIGLAIQLTKSSIKNEDMEKTYKN